MPPCATICAEPLLASATLSRLICAVCVAPLLAGCGGSSGHPEIVRAARAPWEAIMHVEAGAFCDAVTPEVATSIMIALRPPGTAVAATESCLAFMKVHIADAHLRTLAEASLAEQDA